jgi:hypothetical protein
MRHWPRAFLWCTCTIFLAAALCVTQNKPETSLISINADEMREHLTGDPPLIRVSVPGAPISDSRNGGDRCSGYG